MSDKLQKTMVGYDPERDKEKLNHFLFMDNLILFTRTVAELNSLKQSVQGFSNDIKMVCELSLCYDECQKNTFGTKLVQICSTAL